MGFKGLLNGPRSRFLALFNRFKDPHILALGTFKRIVRAFQRDPSPGLGMSNMFLNVFKGAQAQTLGAFERF